MRFRDVANLLIYLVERHSFVIQHIEGVPSLRCLCCHPSYQSGRRMKPPEYPFAGQIHIGHCARSSAGNCWLSLDISNMDSIELSQSGIQFFLLCVGTATHGFAFRLFGFVGSEMSSLAYMDLHDTSTL